MQLGLVAKLCGMAFIMRYTSGTCRWCVDETEQYLKYARDLVVERSQQQWTYDLSWLRENGYSIPVRLQSVCGPEIPETVETRSQSKEISDRRSAFVKGGCCFQ